MIPILYQRSKDSRSKVSRLTQDIWPILPLRLGDPIKKRADETAFIGHPPHKILSQNYQYDSRVRDKVNLTPIPGRQSDQRAFYFNKLSIQARFFHDLSVGLPEVKRVKTPSIWAWISNVLESGSFCSDRNKMRPESSKILPDPSQNYPTRCPYNLLILARVIALKAQNRHIMG